MDAFSQHRRANSSNDNDDNDDDDGDDDNNRTVNNNNHHHTSASGSVSLDMPIPPNDPRPSFLLLLRPRARPADVLPDAALPPAVLATDRTVVPPSEYWEDREPRLRPPTCRGYCAVDMGEGVIVVRTWPGMLLLFFSSGGGDGSVVRSI